MQKPDSRHEPCPGSVLNENHPAHHNPSPTSVRTALDVFAEYDLPLPPQEELELLIELARAATSLFWTAAHYGPDDAEIAFFFSSFIQISAARPTLK